MPFPALPKDILGLKNFSSQADGGQSRGCFTFVNVENCYEQIAMHLVSGPESPANSEPGNVRGRQITCNRAL